MNTIALQATGNVQDSWKRELKRMQSLHDEIKSIVEDPQFDVVVPRPLTSHPSQHTYSASGTLVNVVTTANELIAYVDTILTLHRTPKSGDLESTPRATTKVFIGHGRNQLVRHRVKGFVKDRCRLEPIILEELPSSGMTVIEKLEKYGRVADYAVLILTGDDLDAAGAARARQNVIQELGWFQGVLGRNRTAVLLQKGVEIPSNVAGVVYIEFEGDNVEATFERLRSEFEEAAILPSAS